MARRAACSYRPVDARLGESTTDHYDRRVARGHVGERHVATSAARPAPLTAMLLALTAYNGFPSRARVSLASIQLTRRLPIESSGLPFESGSLAWPAYRPKLASPRRAAVGTAVRVPTAACATTTPRPCVTYYYFIL